MTNWPSGQSKKHESLKVYKLWNSFEYFFYIVFIEQYTAGQCGLEQMISVDATKNKMSNFHLPFSLVLVTKFDVLFLFKNDL